MWSSFLISTEEPDTSTLACKPGLPTTASFSGRWASPLLRSRRRSGSWCGPRNEGTVAGKAGHSSPRQRGRTPPPVPPAVPRRNAARATRQVQLSAASPSSVVPWKRRGASVTFGCSTILYCYGQLRGDRSVRSHRARDRPCAAEEVSSGCRRCRRRPLGGGDRVHAPRESRAGSSLKRVGPHSRSLSQPPAPYPPAQSTVGGAKLGSVDLALSLVYI